MSSITIGGVAIAVTHRPGLRFASLLENWDQWRHVFEGNRSEFHRTVGYAVRGALPLTEPWASHPAAEFAPQGRCGALACWCAVHLHGLLLGDGWQILAGECHWNLASVRNGLIFDPLGESRGGSPSEALAAATFGGCARLGLSKTAGLDAEGLLRHAVKKKWSGRRPDRAQGLGPLFESH